MFVTIYTEGRASLSVCVYTSFDVSLRSFWLFWWYDIFFLREGGFVLNRRGKAGRIFNHSNCCAARAPFCYLPLWWFLNSFLPFYFIFYLFFWPCDEQHSIQPSVCAIMCAKRKSAADQTRVFLEWWIDLKLFNKFFYFCFMFSIEEMRNFRRPNKNIWRNIPVLFCLVFFQSYLNADIVFLNKSETLWVVYPTEKNSRSVGIKIKQEKTKTQSFGCFSRLWEWFTI